ncbi:hypothetical protein BDR06DRAFT_1007271 [Suillus hirtellus]|nr:hypothetical protein BDR06DRAFT_1007271 [Suillus hirtellus]
MCIKLTTTTSAAGRAILAGSPGGRPVHDSIIGFIQKAKDEGGDVLIRGAGDDSKGYFIQPTIILNEDPESITMKEAIFGPVINVYVYDDANYEKTLELIENVSPHALTGSMRVAFKVSVICVD